MRVLYSTKQVALSTTAALLAGVRPGRRSIRVRNTDAAILIYIGPTSGVTAANGALVKAGDAETIEGASNAVYAIAASGTPTVTITEVFEQRQP